MVVLLQRGVALVFIPLECVDERDAQQHRHDSDVYGRCPRHDVLHQRRAPEHGGQQHPHHHRRHYAACGAQRMGVEEQVVPLYDRARGELHHERHHHLVAYEVCRPRHERREQYHHNRGYYVGHARAHPYVAEPQLYGVDKIFHLPKLFVVNCAQRRASRQRGHSAPAATAGRGLRTPCLETHAPRSPA